MRGRFQLFSSGLIVFVVWYVLAYIVLAGATSGLRRSLVFGLAVATGGLVLGALVGVGARAIDLEMLHRGVRAGDARDGVRVSLGRLPDIVPVGRPRAAEPVAVATVPAPGTGSVPSPDRAVPGAQDPSATPPASACASRSGETPASASQTPDGSPAGSPGVASTTATRSTDRPPGSPADLPCAADSVAGATVPAHGFPAPSLPRPTSAGDSIAPSLRSNPDRLATECAAFVRSHECATVATVPDGSELLGAIDRAAHPVEFSEFLELVERLAGNGVDVARVRLEQDADGGPTSVEFPLSNDGNEVQR